MPTTKASRLLWAACAVLLTCLQIARAGFSTKGYVGLPGWVEEKDFIEPVSLEVLGPPGNETLSKEATNEITSRSHLPDVARGKLAGTNSYTAAFNPAKAFDGRSTTWWQAADNGFPRWIVVDLRRLHLIQEVRLTFKVAANWAFIIQGSNDNIGNDFAIYNGMWVTMSDQRNDRTWAAGEAIRFRLGVAGTVARFVRVVFTGVTQPGNLPASLTSFEVLGNEAPQPRDIVPRPVRPARAAGTRIIYLGLNMCNLWANKIQWDALRAFPDRRTILGFYDEAYDVSVDWTIQIAANHGIHFLIGCWYRMSGNAGQSPVLGEYDHCINALSYTAQWRNHMRWVGMYVADQGGGVSGLADFVNNMVPFWVNNWFKRFTYFKVDNNPLLSIFDLEELSRQVGGRDNLKIGFESLRQQARAAGFNSVVILTSNNVDSKARNELAKYVGVDYVYGYHLPTFTDQSGGSLTPSDDFIIESHKTIWKNWQQNSLVQTLVSMSVGWNSKPWNNLFSRMEWKLSPSSWGRLIEEGKKANKARPRHLLSGQMMIFDGYNEYAEGHAIFPTMQDGYAYMEQIGRAFYQRTTNFRTVARPDLTKVPQL